jgi:hypothetical protein
LVQTNPGGGPSSDIFVDHPKFTAVKFAPFNCFNSNGASANTSA